MSNIKSNEDLSKMDLYMEDVEDTQVERILCAAIMYNGQIVSGYRHGDCLRVLDACGISKKDYPPKTGFGFLTSLNRYVNRSEAWIIADKADQILYGKSATCPDNLELVSEHLYFDPNE